MNQPIRMLLQEKYGDVAKSVLSNRDDGVRKIAEAFGYSADELFSVPPDSNMGLSCGNPTATASLRPGEVVLDLGCGGGIDVFLAAKMVGPAGKAIGIDMTPEMIRRAKKNATEADASNVEFHEASIDELPVTDSSVDCIISNCVINLAPDKSAVFREMYRVLKPGGRAAVSDIALKKQLPRELAENLMALVGCIAGAIGIDEYQAGLRSAGFEAVHITDTGADLNAYKNVGGQSACCSPPMQASNTLPVVGQPCCGTATGGDKGETTTVHEGLSAVLHHYDINEYAASVKVYAIKPGTDTSHRDDGAGAENH